VVDAADESGSWGGRLGEGGSGGSKTEGEVETAAESKSRFHNVE
jgi:hypothetical protein